MQYTTGTLGSPGIAQPVVRIRALAAIAAASLRRHRFILGLALISQAIAFLVGSFTGNSPDFDVVRSYAFNLSVAFWVGGCGYAVFRLCWLAFVDRNPSPSREFFASFRRFFSNPERLSNGFNGVVAIMIFTSAFSVLKGAISILEPFSWDPVLAEVDRVLHFGRAPHEWLWWLLDIPTAVFALNFAYNFWFIALISTVFTAAITYRDTLLRHQFLMSFMLVWLIGGFFVAIGFSSAGPCYFDRIGSGGTYQPLMDALTQANETYPIWALSTQDMLWDGFTGASSGSMGISAFPSMHVASAVLFALYATRRSKYAGIVMWSFAAIIMLGSVVLAWHYAIDGYAGALIAVAIWKVTGSVLSTSRAHGLEYA